MNLTLTPRRIAALAAAAAAHNTLHAHDDDFVPVTPDEYLQSRVNDVLDSYATTFTVGLLTPYEFVECFVRINVYDAIVEAAKTDTNIAQYLSVLRAKTDHVNLFSPTVTSGLAYLRSKGLLTQAQADEITRV